ncbi:MAG: methyl-accepting chemotaxis protein, partial [Clostridiales bacterium]|nr:methyl-accepting chemotaxis protein [Clostridiales bacterium]
MTAPKEDILSGLGTLRTSTVIISSFFIVIGIIFSVIMSTLIVGPIKLLTKKLDVITEGDFSQEVVPKLLKSKDETGMLARSTEKMRQSVKAVISTVTKESNNVLENATSQEEKVSRLLSQIEDVSATTEELSAGMQETAASSEEMNAIAEEIEKAIEAMATRAMEGSHTVNEIYERAKTYKETAVKAKMIAFDIDK